MNKQPVKQPDVEEHWVEHLADDAVVLIRPLRDEDHERDKRFLSTITYESRRFRFIAGLSSGLPNLDARLMPVDYHRCMAYVALAHEDGQLRQVGVSRYAGIPGSHNCECAVAVSEQWQRKGLGRLLLKHLIDAARRNGYHCMVSRDLANNYAMHRLTKALGFTSRYLGAMSARSSTSWISEPETRPLRALDVSLGSVPARSPARCCRAGAAPALPYCQ